MSIKAVIFDMDGVLIDAKDWHYDALNEALSLFGYEINRHEHLTTYDGLPTKTKLQRLSLDKGLPERLHSFINEMKQQYTINLIHKLCRPQFNHEYALSRLKTEGFRLAAASNSIRYTMDMMLGKANLLPYLNFTLSNEDVSIPKPSSEIYLKAIKLLELEPNDCLIVEDNENGIKAARDSGANVMIVKDVIDVNYKNILKHIKQYEDK